jgi:hypothetical protein
MVQLDAGIDMLENEQFCARHCVSNITLFLSYSHRPASFP